MSLQGVARSEADRVARELIAQATGSAKVLGKPITPEEVMRILTKAIRSNVPDPEFGELILERAKDYLEDPGCTS